LADKVCRSTLGDWSLIKIQWQLHTYRSLWWLRQR